MNRCMNAPLNLAPVLVIRQGSLNIVTLVHPWGWFEDWISRRDKSWFAGRVIKGLFRWALASAGLKSGFFSTSFDFKIELSLEFLDFV